MTLDQIYDTEWMSVRTYNVCKDNSLTDIEKLLNYYRDNHTFINLRNCGRKSNNELIEICEKYNDINTNEINIIEPNEIVSTIENFNRNQRITVNSFISVKFATLSARSKNAILDYLSNNLSIRNFSANFFSNKSFDIKKIKNIGEKSEKEIANFIEDIKTLVLKVENTKESLELKKLRIQYSIQKIFKIDSSIINKYLTENFISESTPFLGIINLLLEQNCFFKETYTDVFISTIRIYNNKEPLSLNQTSDSINLTKERVRQLRKNTLQDFITNIQKLSFLELDLDEINLNDNILTLDNEQENILNRNNNTSFNSSFITLIIATLKSDEYILVGNIEDVIFEKEMTNRFKHNWKNLYLVPVALNKDFLYQEFVDDVSNRINNVIPRSYVFNFGSYLLNFTTNRNNNFLEKLSLTCEYIINKEFNIYVDINDNIVFKRNTFKQVYEYSLEALEKLGKPSKVSEIHEQVIKLYPTFTNGESSIRASLKRKFGFIPFGRTSTFGLKKWEKEDSQTRGGTIREFVIEYLKQHKTPKHINDITNYVVQFRKRTSAYSIQQNLKLDNSKTFVFYKKSHIGLKEKMYPDSYLKAGQNKDKKTWEESYNSLQIFISENNSLPSSKTLKQEEKTLCNWFNIQKFKYKNNKLNSVQLEKIKIIINQFNLTTRKSRINVFEKYTELKEFILTKKRLPQANIKEEANLYQFYYNQRKLFKNKELSEIMISNFIDIIKTIQTIKNEH